MTIPRLLITILAASAASAQLAPPNAQGVSMGHVHLNTADPEIQKKFWIDLLGAKPFQQSTLTGVSAPGVVVLFRKAVPTGGSVGSSVNHIGFFVPDLAPFYAKVDAAGYKHYKPATATPQMMIDCPEGL